MSRCCMTASEQEDEPLRLSTSNIGKHAAPKGQPAAATGAGTSAPTRKQQQRRNAVDGEVGTKTF